MRPESVAVHSAAQSACVATVANRSTARHRSAVVIDLLERHVPCVRTTWHGGDLVHRSGMPFDTLHLVVSGLVKVLYATEDGRERIGGLRLRGDWLGFDGLADGRHARDAVVIDAGQTLAVRYEALIAAGLRVPDLLRALHAAMGREAESDQATALAVCTLPADARVADFLRRWSESLAERDLRADEITLHLTRAEIGNHLGLTLETVSRAMSRLARDRVIRFDRRHPRELSIPARAELDRYIEQRSACA